MTRLPILFSFPILVVGACGLLPAQDYAVLTGTVTDPSGATVPSVNIEVLHEATNVLSRTTSTERGSFRAPYLAPGTYTVSCEAAGFKKFVRRSVLLNAGQNGFLSIELEVGATQEQVTVTAEAPLLEATTANRGVVLDTKQVTEIPLANRNAMALPLMSVAVSYRVPSQKTNAFSAGSLSMWSINGSPEAKSDYLLDGAPNNSQAGLNNIGAVPSVEAVEEIRIHTNSYDAEYGHTAGGIVSLTTKSGTNDLHGGLFDFIQRSALQANTFANNAAKVPMPPVYLNQYGFVVSGPVVLPKVYSGRNRTFFMVNLEKYYQKLSYPITASVAAPEMIQGDFSNLTNTAGQQILIFDPSTGRQEGANWVRAPFAGNIIPANRIDPVAKAILSYFPKPTRPAGPNLGYTQNNIYIDPGNIYPFYDLALKVDENLGSNHRVSYRFVKSKWNATNWNGSNGILGTPGSTAHYYSRANDAHSITWISTLSPSAVVSLRGSFNQFVEASSQTPENYGFDPSKFGLQAKVIAQLPNPTIFGRHTFSGYSGLGTTGTVNITNNFAFHPQLSVVRSAHTLKAGVDMRWVRYTAQSQHSWGFSSTPGFTQRNYLVVDATSGNSIASFLLGGASSSATYNVHPLYSIHYYAPYMQDDWRISRRLTINLGLRWDFNLAPWERFDRLGRGFASSSVNPVTQQVNLSMLPAQPKQLMGGLLFAGVGGVPRKTFDTTYTNLQPRAGFAYRISEKMVVRGGWGRYYINPDNASLLNPGFARSTGGSASNDGGRTPVGDIMTNPFANGVNLPTGSSLGLLTAAGSGFNFANPDFRPPHADLFTVGLQYRLPLSSVVEAAYSGNRSSDLQSIYPYNEPDLTVRRSCDWWEGGNPAVCDKLMPNPFQGVAAFSGTSHFTATQLTYYQLSRPYPHFLALNQVMVNDKKTWYNAAQLSWQTRQLKNANIMVNYSFSKMMMTGYSTWYLGTGADYFDVQRKQLARGIYEGDMTHQFKAVVIYTLPFGRGNRWLNTSNAFLNRVVGGWQLSTFLRYVSGVPAPLPGNVFYIKDARVPTVDWAANTVRMYGSCVAQWNYDGSIRMLAHSVASGCTEYNWLVQPAYAPRVTPFHDSRMRTHTTPVADLMISKSVPIYERLELRLRFEAYNFTNTQNSAGNIPDTNPLNSTFGTFARATAGNNLYYGANMSRVVQLGAKLVW